MDLRQTKLLRDISKPVSETETMHSVYGRVCRNSVPDFLNRMENATSDLQYGIHDVCFGPLLKSYQTPGTYCVSVSFILTPASYSLSHAINKDICSFIMHVYDGLKFLCRCYATSALKLSN
jgi:hypothetical protein